MLFFPEKKSAQYFQICKFSAYHTYGPIAISSWYDVIPLLLGGFSLEKDNDVLYFTTDTL